jgi:hypothetical protein
MKRGIITVAAALSAAVCVAASALWLRSYWRHDLVCLMFRAPAQYQCHSMRGTFQIHRMVFPPGEVDNDPRYVRTVQAPRKVRLTRLRGEDLRDRRLGPFAVQSGELTYHFVQVAFPCWSVVATSAILPAYWLVLRRRWRRQRLCAQGRCERCGYDVRASPDRCPECGTPIDSGTVAKGTASVPV